MNLAAELHYGPDGLVPVVLQDHETLEVLIVGFANREAVERTLSTDQVHLWSRSRGELWLKGGTSGRLQHVVEVRPNCELNSLLLLVRQVLPGACHTGHSTCYYRRLNGDNLEEIAPPLFDTSAVYPSQGPQLLIQLLEAYRWLKEQPVIPASSTSRTLHGDGQSLWTRVREEWDELRGVLAGTHIHEGREEDLRLEAYQVLYWTSLCHVLADEIDDGTAWSELQAGYDGAASLEHFLSDVQSPATGTSNVAWLWRAFGVACREANLDPASVIERDLQDLRSKPYVKDLRGLRPDDK